MNPFKPMLPLCLFWLPAVLWAAPYNPAMWNLTVPVKGAEGFAATIDTPSLPGYSSEYFSANDERIQFWAPVTGATTDSSGFPRSELREAYKDGRLRNWNYRDAVNTLEARVSVEQIPSSGRIAIGQIHVFQRSTPLLIVYYNKGDIEARVRPVFGKTPNEPVLLVSKVPLGKRFSYKAVLDRKGKLTVSASYGDKSSSLNLPIDSSWASQSLYFKAGSYVQDNSGASSEGGRVSFYSLKASHL